MNEDISSPDVSVVSWRKAVSSVSLKCWKLISAVSLATAVSMTDEGISLLPGKRWLTLSETLERGSLVSEHSQDPDESGGRGAAPPLHTAWGSTFSSDSFQSWRWIMCHKYTRSNNIFTVFVCFDNCSLIENQDKILYLAFLLTSRLIFHINKYT